MDKNIFSYFYSFVNKNYVDFYLLFICVIITTYLSLIYLKKEKNFWNLMVGFLFLTLSSSTHILRRYIKVNSALDIVRIIILAVFLILALLNIFYLYDKKNRKNGGVSV